MNATGRRINAVLQLRYEYLRRGADGQLVALRWPADTDKMGQAWETPINATVRAGLERVLADRPGLGRAYLFPSPRNPAHAEVFREVCGATVEFCYHDSMSSRNAAVRGRPIEGPLVNAPLRT